MIYLKFNEEKKKIMREEESKMNKNAPDGQKKDAGKQDLEIVDEEGEDDLSEYDINSEFDSDSKSDSTDKDEDEKNETNPSQTNSNAINKIIDQASGPKGEKGSNKEDKSEVDKGDDDKGKNSDEDKKNQNLNDTIESEDDDPIDKMKNQINKKFIKKIDKILDYLEKNNINFNNADNNPKILLKQLKAEANILEKNHIIDKIESILKDFYKDNNYSRDNKD
jgi:hypothetical protein